MQEIKESEQQQKQREEPSSYYERYIVRSHTIEAMEDCKANSGEGTDKLHCCCASAMEQTRNKLEELKLEKTTLEKRKEEEVSVLRQKSLEYERLLKASRDSEKEAEKRWDSQLQNVAEKIAEQQDIWDEYRYFFVQFCPSECKLQDLPVFHKHKIIRSVVWKAIWNHYAIVELEAPLTKTEYDVEDIFDRRGYCSSLTSLLHCAIE